MPQPSVEAGLLSEMRALLEKGASVVIARAGVVVAQASGRGIGPLLSLYEAKRLAGAVVCDKVIGRAAAAICVAGGVQTAFATLMSAGAAAFLKDRGVSAAAEQIVPQIANRTRTGICPMECAVADLDDPVEMVAAIRAKLQELQQGERA